MTAAQKAEKKRCQKEFMTIFINGKQKRVRRPITIEGMDPMEFIMNNADPIWLVQNEMYEELYAFEQESIREDDLIKSQGFSPDSFKLHPKEDSRPKDTDEEFPF